MTTNYHLHVDQPQDAISREGVLREIERMEELDKATELTIEGVGPDWIDYADLVLKALLVIAAFVIAARIGG